MKQKKPNSETYPIVQHTDVTLNKNKTEAITLNTQNANYAELIITKNIHLFLWQTKEIAIIFLDWTQQQHPVLRQLLLWKQFRKRSTNPTLTFSAKKDFYTTIDVSKTYASTKQISSYNTYKRHNGQNYVCSPLNSVSYHTLTRSFRPSRSWKNLCYNKAKNTFSLLSTVFHITHSHYLSGHTGRAKLYATTARY